LVGFLVELPHTAQAHALNIQTIVYMQRSSYLFQKGKVKIGNEGYGKICSPAHFGTVKFHHTQTQDATRFFLFFKNTTHEFIGIVHKSNRNSSEKRDPGFSLFHSVCQTLTGRV